MKMFYKFSILTKFVYGTETRNILRYYLYYVLY